MQKMEWSQGPDGELEIERNLPAGISFYEGRDIEAELTRIDADGK